MKKHLILILILPVLLTAGLSGCIDNVNRAASDTGTCCVLSIIGLVFFIILIAYLLGGKKTVVQTQQSPSTSIPAPIIIHKETPLPKREKEKSKPERRCPGCGRVIPDDAKMCPYCGKKFTSFSDKPASNIYQKVKDFKDGKSSNQDYSVLDEKEINYAEYTKEMYKKAHDFQYKKNDIDKAHAIYKKIIDEYPDSDEAIYAKQQINNIESTDNFKKDTNSKKNEQNKVEADKETEEKEIKKERFCFECGAKLEGSPKFCPMCGTKLEES